MDALLSQNIVQVVGTVIVTVALMQALLMLYAAWRGVGNYGSALSNRTGKVVGGSLGYQWFLDPYRRQLVFEVGGRQGTSLEIDGAAAIGGRFQQAIGRRLILRGDAFASVQEDRDEGFGVRSELQVRF